jgi:hypothetical protein
LFGGSIVVVVLGLDGRRSLSDGRSSNPRVPSSKGVVIRAQWIWHGTNFCFTTAMLSLVNFIVLWHGQFEIIGSFSFFLFDPEIYISTGGSHPFYVSLHVSENGQEVLKTGEA